MKKRQKRIVRIRRRPPSAALTPYVVNRPKVPALGRPNLVQQRPRRVSHLGRSSRSALGSSVAFSPRAGDGTAAASAGRSRPASPFGALDASPLGGGARPVVSGKGVGRGAQDEGRGDAGGEHGGRGVNGDAPVARSSSVL